jgi:hypothetical protein
MAPDPAPTAVASRAATLMAYVVGVVGAGAATLALRAGEPVDAALVLTVSLGVAALLAATGTLLRSIEGLERRLRRIEDDLGSASR